jgi:anti-sigma regulatory factor (Ser/Thr protein kinase)
MHYQQHISRLGLCKGTERVRLGVAVEEALLNGIHHGNLELDSKLRQGNNNAYAELGEQRRRLQPYCDRRVHVQLKIDSEQAVLIIRDEGPGFDPKIIPDPNDPENLTKPSGRGLLLIRTFMDSVFHNATGNQITMIKRRRAAA